MSARLELYYTVISGEDRRESQEDLNHYETIGDDFLNLSKIKTKPKNPKV